MLCAAKAVYFIPQQQKTQCPRSRDRIFDLFAGLLMARETVNVNNFHQYIDIFIGE